MRVHFESHSAPFASDRFIRVLGVQLVVDLRVAGVHPASDVPDHVAVHVDDRHFFDVFHCGGFVAVGSSLRL